MPELPDVAVFARILEQHGLARPIAAVAVHDARILADITPEEFTAALQGDRLQQVRRHGKHLFAARARGGFLHFHFGMTGALEPFEASEPPYSRLVLRFPEPCHLAYVNVRMLGEVGLVEDVAAFLEAHGIGPDALDPTLTPAWFAEALGRSRRSIKAALMDQGLIAGLGNVYADEVLFQAGLRPDVPVAALDRSWRARLFAILRSVLAEAVRRGAASERFTERLPEDWLTRVRGRKDARCPRCGTALATLRIGGRTSWYCPRCQQDPRQEKAAG